jgi:hypothetical protein
VPFSRLVTAAAVTIALSGSVAAAEISEQLSVGGVVAGAYQYLDSDDPGGGTIEVGAGAFVVQPEFDFTPTERDQIFFKLGFADGNAINDQYGEIYPSIPWAADLDVDVTSINGRDRDYLLTGWYRRGFGSEHNGGGITVGIIDATDYLDHNRYANDEYGQFMNAAFVNAANTFFPSYDLGGALEWNIGNFGIHAVYMSIGDTDDSGLFDDGVGTPAPIDDETNPWRYYGLELHYKAQTRVGEGNYQFIWSRSSDSWINVDQDELVRRETFLVSIDQDFGPAIGIFFRFGVQDDEALQAAYKNLFTAGVDLHGFTWGNIGIGLGRGDGTDQADFETFQLAEAYARWNFSKVAFLTGDLQYQRADDRTGEDPSGFVAGLRLTAEF